MNWSKIFYGFLVIAALFVVALILVPTVSTGCGGGSAVQSASRNQYANYITALHMFKGEYGSYPEFFGDGPEFVVPDYQTSAQFIEALSGRSLNGEKFLLMVIVAGFIFITFPIMNLQSRIHQDYVKSLIVWVTPIS